MLFQKLYWNLYLVRSMELAMYIHFPTIDLFHKIHVFPAMNLGLLLSSKCQSTEHTCISSTSSSVSYYCPSPSSCPPYSPCTTLPKSEVKSDRKFGPGWNSRPHQSVFFLYKYMWSTTFLQNSSNFSHVNFNTLWSSNASSFNRLSDTPWVFLLPIHFHTHSLFSFLFPHHRITYFVLKNSCTKCNSSSKCIILWCHDTCEWLSPKNHLQNAGDQGWFLSARNSLWESEKLTTKICQRLASKAALCKQAFTQ